MLLMSGRRPNTTPELEPFGLHIRALRKAANLSQEEVAHRAEMDRGYLSGIENGKRNPTLTQLLKLAKGLEVNLVDLINYGE
ncbi:helix-turn-helix domain-containing protein [Pseudoteredinibacter isoporae]|uniref:helix-turn-helix domain-containing protein n=1 Tax=Pseudoteredinibacter isoporae TaxID=570281 RepID=UPI00310AFF5B